MFINNIDKLIDTILNNFNNYINELKIFKTIILTTNFVKYQKDIIIIIKNFINSIDKNNILTVIKKNYFTFFINIIKKYCAFYIYLNISYYYKDSRDLFITNIIECSRIEINYDMGIFFTSNNNSKIIKFFIDIKNLISLLKIKSIDKIKLVLDNNINKYESTIELLNNLDEEYIINYFIK